MSKKNKLQATNKNQNMEGCSMEDYRLVKEKLGAAGEDAEFLEMVTQNCRYCYMVEMMEIDDVIPFSIWLTDDVMETIMSAFMAFAAIMSEQEMDLSVRDINALNLQDEQECKELLEFLEETGKDIKERRCPRCGQNELPRKKSKMVYSSHAKVAICPACKANETYRISEGRKALPFVEWDVIQFIETDFQQSA